MGFLCLFMLNCFLPWMLDFYSMQSAWGFLQMGFNAIINPANRLFVNWVNMASQIQDCYLPSISGIVVHGRCSISHCFYFFVVFHECVGWFLFFVFVFMPLHSSLSKQRHVLNFPDYFVSDWLLLNFILIFMVLLHYILWQY